MASQPLYLTLSNLFSLKLYRIPDYQRGYAWTSRQLEDLWTDLEVLEDGSQHFTGMIVVKLRKKRYNESEMCEYEELEVIDGQQRLTTLVLLMHSIIHALCKIEGQGDISEQVDKLRDTFIGKSGWFRLSLNDDSRIFFEHLLASGNPLTSVENGSQQNLLNAVLYFRERIEELGDSDSTRLRGIRRLVARLQQSLRFVFYVVDNDAEAGLIFEVMNNRGKELSQADRLKNYLMYLAYKVGLSDEDISSISGCWGSFFKKVMEAAPEGANSEDIENRILRNHWILFKEADTPKKYRGLPISQRIKQEFQLVPTEPDGIQKRNEELGLVALEYTRNLMTTAHHFAELFQPEGSLAWVSDENVRSELKGVLLSFHRMGHIAAILPVLLAGRAKLERHPELFLRLARALSVFAFRTYAICNRRGHTGQAHLRRQARHLMNAGDSVVLDVVREITRDVYEWTRWYGGDEKVEESLRDSAFYGSHRPQEIRYLFFEYERELCHGQEPSVDWSTFSDSRKHQVEHIWARGVGWLGGCEQTHRDNVNRLGNLTVTHFNQTLGKKPFVEKRDIYAKSNVLVENSLQHVDEWDIQQIDERESQLVEFVFSRWNIPDLSESVVPEEPKEAEASSEASQ
ncbi:MAG: hypothetical protein CL920_37485 [Deltaproteobacteria bacterium]|nr:hypothetical protein [Deltaproteobacteria bacterium]MBU54425.1 hypothetical protein [Deltaproteobacteria bacterium]|tara:strand:+ start:5381 stop:7264 length:1884 start_codon:yes stop_codon:yes gene_type:complete